MTHPDKAAPLSHTDKLEAIKQACIEANRSAFIVRECDCGMLLPRIYPDGVRYRAVHLADVLVCAKALHQDAYIRWNRGYPQYFYIYSGRDSAEFAAWNLSMPDDLTAQSPETIDFLYSLLSPSA